MAENKKGDQNCSEYPQNKQKAMSAHFSSVLQDFESQAPSSVFMATSLESAVTATEAAAEEGASWSVSVSSRMIGWVESSPDFGGGVEEGAVRGRLSGGDFHVPEQREKAKR